MTLCRKQKNLNPKAATRHKTKKSAAVSEHWFILIIIRIILLERERLSYRDQSWKWKYILHLIKVWNCVHQGVWVGQLFWTIFSSLRTISKFSHFLFTFNFDQLALRYNQTLNSLKVIAHSNFNAEFDTVITNNKIGYSRAAGQFGNLLPKELQINSGVGPKFSINKDPIVSVLRPTQVFDENLKITIGNVTLTRWYIYDTVLSKPYSFWNCVRLLTFGCEMAKLIKPREKKPWAFMEALIF